jgi:NAD-dependent deacetylase
LIETLRSARYVVVLTGAGVSAESRIPTFREAQTGLWAKYSPEELATPQAFRRNPKLVWEWYTWRRELVAGAKPNPGHLALGELEQRVPQFTLITQNVDGLHQRAGSRSVIELHGNLNRTNCFEERNIVDSWPPTTELPPRCPRCGGHLRPDVVWFGESLPAQALHTAFEAARQCDLFFSIGTSALVQPAASLPYEALQHVTPLTPNVTYALRGSAGQVLPELLNQSKGGDYAMSF